MCELSLKTLFSVSLTLISSMVQNASLDHRKR